MEVLFSQEFQIETQSFFSTFEKIEENFGKWKVHVSSQEKVVNDFRNSLSFH